MQHAGLWVRFIAENKLHQMQLFDSCSAVPLAGVLVLVKYFLYQVQLRASREVQMLLSTAGRHQIPSHNSLACAQCCPSACERVGVSNGFELTSNRQSFTIGAK